MAYKKNVNSFLQTLFSLDSYTDLLLQKLSKIPLFNKKNFWLLSYAFAILYFAGIFTYCSKRSDKSAGIYYMISLSLFIVVYFLLLYGITRGRHSVVHNLICLVLANSVVALIIGLNIILFTSGKANISVSLWLFVYGALWVVYTFISDAGVSKLSNGIISGLSVLAFTCMGFYVNTLSDKTIINFIIAKLPQAEIPILELDHALQINGYSMIQVLNAMLGVLLPFIGFSTFCVVLVDAKQYWLSKQLKQKTNFV